MKDLINEIYKLCYNPSSLRGKDKQDKINEGIESFLTSKEKYQKCIFRKEVSVPSWFGDSESFRVDVGVCDEIGDMKNLALGKAVAASVGKNKKNLLKTLVGEINEPKSELPMTFVNFLPNETPIFDKKDNIKSIEKNKLEFIYKDSAQSFPRDFDEFYITFDIDGISNCKTREDVENIFASGNPIKNISIKENSYRKPKVVHE